MRDEKNFGKFLLAFVLVVAMFSFVSATVGVTVNNPITWGNYSATMNVSIKNDLINGTVIPYNVTLYCNVSGGSVNARLAGDKIVTISNSTGTATIFENAATSISSFTDSMLYNCSAYADNGTATTGQAFSVAVNNITIDNTAPTCSISVSYPLIHKSGLQTINWAVADAISLVSSSETITQPSPGTQLSYALASNTITWSGVNTTYTGTWNMNAYGIDRAGNTCNATTSFLTDLPGGSITVTDGVTQQEQPNYGLLLIIAGIIIAFVVFSNKKK